MDRIQLQSEENSSCLPYFVEGEVVKGFGRGSKELGIPTANFPEKIVRAIPESFKCGVYYGWASVDNGEVFPMVMSVGWNPYYHNTVKTMEIHIMHVFQADFYHCTLKVIVLGYVRPMEDFSSLDALIHAMNSDIVTAQEKLALLEHQTFKGHVFFRGQENNRMQHNCAQPLDASHL